MENFHHHCHADNFFCANRDIQTGLYVREKLFMTINFINSVERRDDVMAVGDFFEFYVFVFIFDSSDYFGLCSDSVFIVKLFFMSKVCEFYDKILHHCRFSSLLQ
jgi:hypothetical protein